MGPRLLCRNGKCCIGTGWANCRPFDEEPGSCSLTEKATVSGLGVDGELPIERHEALEDLAQGKGPVLFNLAEHKDELFDYSAQRPDIVKQLSELAERKLDETRQARIPLWQPKIDLVVQRDSLEWGAHEGKSSSMLFAVFLDFGANEI